MCCLGRTSSSSTLLSTGLEHTTGMKLLSSVYRSLYILKKEQTVNVYLSSNRMIQNSFIDMESMFKLFTEEEEVSGRFFIEINFAEALG